jgi:hypothetical protein
MTKQTPQTRTLQRALQIAGNAGALAGLLGCDAAQLARWLAGDEPTPAEIYLRALDIVSGNSLSGNSRSGNSR